MERRISSLVDAIAEGLRLPALPEKLDALEAQRAGLLAKIGATPPAAPALHLNLAAGDDRGQARPPGS